MSGPSASSSGVRISLLYLWVLWVQTSPLPATESDSRFQWDEATGLTFQVTGTAIRLGESPDSLTVRFPTLAKAVKLLGPEASRPSADELILRYEGFAPDGNMISLERHVNQSKGTNGDLLVEALTLRSAGLITNDLEIEWHFRLQQPIDEGSAGPGAMDASAIVPLKNGWAKSLPLVDAGVQAEYRLGHSISGPGIDQLALPLVTLRRGRNTAALFSDPTFSALFDLRPSTNGAHASVRWRYAATQVPLRAPETRTLALWLSRDAAGPQDLPRALDLWFSSMLPDVPPGPQWLHSVAMVGYDFLSDNGEGWERDLRALAGWIRPAARARVALCLHGWYDALGSYCYDPEAKRMREQWVAFARTRKVSFTQAELRRRLRLARDLGFRALLYFADGLAADSGVPGYHDDWAYRDAKGNKIAGWQGPDTFGPTHLLNPSNPEVFARYTNYLAALLTTYGEDLDGFVWDETFHARAEQVASSPRPAYCARAMLALVRALTQQVHALGRQKVFLTSDCIGVAGWEDVPGYAMVADGTYQDSHCDSAAWSYSLFPNWRNTVWSCNWDDISGFQNTKWGVENFEVPVAISNGWGDDLGPAEWTPIQREAMQQLFRRRLRAKRTVRFMTQDPRQLVATAPDHPQSGDAIPEPGRDEVNWALASRGTSATASSEEGTDPGPSAAQPAGASPTPAGTWPASGVIDGRRDESGWGRGHGWVSLKSQPLPQWLRLDLDRPRRIQRVVVITYQKEHSAETAGKWGVQGYQVQAWDAPARDWRPIATEARDFPVKVRVHRLAAPVETDKLRIVITRVAPLDGQARLLQLEAWGDSQ
jgi:hypothetical protein